MFIVYVTGSPVTLCQQAFRFMMHLFAADKF